MLLLVKMETTEQLQGRSRADKHSSNPAATTAGTRMRSKSPSADSNKSFSAENNDNEQDLFLNPRPVQVVRANADHTFSLNTDQLRTILLDERVAGLDTVVISVAGAFRKGKSFLLDFMLRYLHDAEQRDAAANDENAADAVVPHSSSTNETSSSSSSDAWLGDADKPLTGFHWRSGSERDTTGMYMWSKPFVKRLSDGRQVAILLLDTQGTFDSQSTVKECATIFAVSTMISSVQVYNLSANVQEDDLQHLQLFTEYGRLALQQQPHGTKPFQSLLFLVRDWMNPFEYEYGYDGGQKLIKKRLEVVPQQHHELQQLREHLRLCFEKIECFLMPHPGLKVATNPKFDGRLSEVESDFRSQLARLIPGLLAPNRLVPKYINGSRVKCRDLFVYLESYLHIYRDNERLPEPKSMLEATAEANNLQAVNIGKIAYKEVMDEVCGSAKPYIPPELLLREHEHAKAKGIDAFENTPKMGGEVFSTPYLQRLHDDLQKEFEDYRQFNESKNVFSAFRTPAVFFIGLAVLYVVHSIFYFVGISHVVTSLLSWAMWALIVMIGFWAYCNTAGQADYIESLNDIADVMYDAVVRPVWHFVLSSSLGGTTFQHLQGGSAAAASSAAQSKRINDTQYEKRMEAAQQRQTQASSAGSSSGGAVRHRKA